MVLGESDSKTEGSRILQTDSLDSQSEEVIVVPPPVRALYQPEPAPRPDYKMTAE